MFGKQLGCMAYGEGPGGPINTILMTQALYQVILDILIDG
jgi:hypothetical protein